MVKHRFIDLRKKIISRSLLIISLLFYASVVFSQSPVNFSGTWIQDTVKSDAFYKAFNVVSTITQTPQTINVKTTFSDEKGNEMAVHENLFTLDGKEVIRMEDGVKNMNLATWSADKKILTTKSTSGTGNNIAGVTKTYSISEDGLVLKVKSSDINPGGLTVNQLFNKKK